MSRLEMKEIREKMMVSRITVSRKGPSDGYNRGNHLLNYEVSLVEPISLEDARVASTLAALEVDMSVLRMALAGGSISKERYLDEISICKRNYNTVLGQLAGVEEEPKNGD